MFKVEILMGFDYKNHFHITLSQIDSFRELIKNSQLLSLSNNNNQQNLSYFEMKIKKQYRRQQKLLHQ